MPRGMLVVVVGPEGSGKELLIAIARRRFDTDASLSFPVRVTTRGSSEPGGNVAVSRRAFRDMAGQGAFLCTWETGGHAFGLPQSTARCLADGRTVVVAAEREAVERFRMIWPDVRMVEVRSGPDVIRTDPGPLAVNHRGDVAEAVRRFHEILVAMRLERLTQAASPGHRGSSVRVLSRLVGGRRGGALPKGLRSGRPPA